MDENRKDDEYRFVSEQIKDMPPNKKKTGGKIALTAVCAAVFGLVAAIVFSAARPIFTSWFDSEGETVSLSDESIENTEDEDDAAEDADDEEAEQVIITQTQEMELEDYQVLQNKLYNVGREANKSVVSITSITSIQDWFDNDYESEGTGAGIIIAETSDNYMVVTEKKLIEDAGQIYVMFYNDDTAKASLVAYDADTGIAVLSVAKSGLSDSTVEYIEAIELGSSAGVTQGTMVIAIGSPLGSAFSILTGNVASTGNEVTGIDGNYTVITTDISASDGGSGALINIDGELVGLILQSYSSSGSNTVTAIGISQIRDLVEDLSNGNTPAYLGLEISTVTSDISEEYDLPVGVYIKEVLEESPAEAAGLKEGDIIVQIDGEDIISEYAYEQFLEEKSSGDQIVITVMRMGANESYQSVECDAVLSELK